MTNASNVFLFTLTSFSATTNYRITLFSLTCLCYCTILVVNVCLILTIVLDQNLHEPMYIFVCNLCINGLYGTAAFYPKFAADLLSDIHVISYVGCFLQIFVIYTYATTDFSVLALMAYDRYVAICRPLEYHLIMSLRRSAVLIGVAWIVPIVCEILVVSLTSNLKLCGSHIQKLYCENWSVVKLACGSTTANSIVGMIIILFYCGHVLFILCSYVPLVKSAIKSKESRKKFTQTCVPHLLCLLNVTAALLFDVMYSRYGSASVAPSVKNFMAIQFLMMPPIFNPIIYGMILTKIRQRMVRLCMMACQNYLSWTAHTTAVVKKAQQRLHLLRVLRRNPVKERLLVAFYRSTIESVLTYGITAWYANCSEGHKNCPKDHWLSLALPGRHRRQAVSEASEADCC
ncbi:olfactory receptor 10H2-like [Cheilinus undulatus]|uniref:olfactory receptor 10H2-like n=1 Tax=Cheilinus undulatus TaxID=241271 RepID=UPI001BD4E89C|nr:olfactory receptor 10H2-like [Cheilinus undulatus]